MQIFTPLDCYSPIDIHFISSSLSSPCSTSTRCDIKGFIITIQSNSIPTGVASTWRRRRHTMERRVDYYWRALNFEMVVTTAAIPWALYPLQDLFMCWMVSDTFTVLFIHVCERHSILMDFNTIFIFFLTSKTGEHPAAKYTSGASLSCFSQSVVPCTTFLLLYHHCRTRKVVNFFARLSWLL